MKQVSINQVVENRLSNGYTIVCRVIGFLSCGMPRVCSVIESGSVQKIIGQNKSWGAPLENLFPHDVDCPSCHKNGLITFIN